MIKQLFFKPKSFLFLFFFLTFSINIFSQSSKDLIVFDDALKNDFQDYSWRGKDNKASTFNFAATTQVRSGSKSIGAIAGEAYNYISFFKPGTLINASDYPGGIRFWVYGSKLSGNNNTLKLNVYTLGSTEYTSTGNTKVKSSAIASKSSKSIEITTGKWTLVTASWADLGNITTLDHIAIGSNTDQIGQEFFIDDLILSTNTTPRGTYIYDDAFGLGHTLTGYPSAAAGVPMIQSTSSIRREISNSPFNRNEPVKAGNKAIYFQHGPNYSALVLMKYSDKPELTKDYPGGFGFWVFGTAPTLGKNGAEITISTYGYAGPPTYGWNEPSIGMTTVVPLYKWSYVSVSWAALGNPSRVAGYVFAPTADTHSFIAGNWAGGGNTAFIIDELKLLPQAPCPYPSNTIDGKVTLEGLPLNLNGMYVTVLKNDEIENVTPVINSRFTFDRKFCDGTYDITLSTSIGGSDIPAAPQGYEFKRTTSGLVSVEGSGRYTLTFKQGAPGNIKLVGDLNFDLKAIPKTSAARQGLSTEENLLNLEIGNPITDDIVKVRTTALEPSFSMFNKLGQKINSNIKSIGNGNYTITPSLKLEGMYFLKIESKSGSTTKKLIFK